MIKKCNKHLTSKNEKRKKLFIPMVILLLIVILLFIIVGIINYKDAKTQIKRTVKNEGINDTINISQEVKDTTDDEIYAVIKISDNEYGIEEIVTPKGSVITANGKKQVSIDYTFEADKEYVFSITNRLGEKKDKIIKIDSRKDLEMEISKINKTGNTEAVIKAKSSTIDEIILYNINAIVIDGDLILDGQTQVVGSTLKDNIYEFGNKNTDVATETQDAKKMVLLKVNGNLTINSGVTLTACKSDDGYGGPKGLAIYCTGKITNNGTISMTARGAKANGENVYLWQNKDKEYEYVPAVGAEGGAGYTLTRPSNSRWNTRNGNNGSNGSLRKTGGGGTGAARLQDRQITIGKGGNGTSYSGGIGSAGACNDCDGGRAVTIQNATDNRRNWFKCSTWCCLWMAGYSYRRSWK